MTLSLSEQMTELGRKAKAAARRLSTLTTDEKNACLLAMAEAIEAHSARFQEANVKDLATAREMGLSKAMLDRLELNDKRIAGMAQGLREVAALPDPVGRVLDERTLPNQLQLRKVTTPIGVVVIIYESRPNVTADAASLCFKSGNATILRGGKEALNSNQAIAAVLVEAARKTLSDFPEDAIQVVPTTDRAAVPALLALTEYVDLCMPRGGEGLIRAVAECSKVPVIKHYKGVCHVYVDRDADLKMGADLAINSKCQRPGVCNAAETILVDEGISETFLPTLAARLQENNVEIRADDRTLKVLRNRSAGSSVKPATDEDFHTEYNDFIVNLKVVPGVAGAVDHIETYGSHHSDTIVTGNEETARQFLSEVDSAAVYWNASTRFTDGNQFGMGAEIGISTDKIGARGPMGLEELTSYKWLGIGTGQLRQ